MPRSEPARRPALRRQLHGARRDLVCAALVRPGLAARRRPHRRGDRRRQHGDDLRPAPSCSAWPRPMSSPCSSAPEWASARRWRRARAAGLFWVAAAFGITYLFERRGLALWLINGGYHAAPIHPVRPDPRPDAPDRPAPGHTVGESACGSSGWLGERRQRALPQADAAPFAELEADLLVGAGLAEAERLVQPRRWPRWAG